MAHVECFVQQNTGLAEVVQSKLDRSVDRKLHLAHGGNSYVMLEAADPERCSPGRLSGH